MSKLKPCPFCGSSAQVWKMNVYDAYCVECSNEKCGANIGHSMSLDATQAVRHWNRRKEQNNEIN